MAEEESRPVPVEVTAHAGYRSEEYPKAFRIGSGAFAVEKILDRWFGPDHAYFKVLADDRNLYILRHDRPRDCWELVYTETKTVEGGIDSTPF